MMERFQNIKKVFNFFKREKTKDIQVRFLTHNVDDILIPMCLSIDKLWEDWYGECNYVPENGAFILDLCIIWYERIFVIHTCDLEGFTFEDMMEIIREIWY